MSGDTLYVYGARCSWHGPITAIGWIEIKGYSLPCCPYCQGVLFELSTKDEWDRLVETYVQNSGDESYKDFIKWTGENRCYPSFEAAQNAWRAARVN